MYVVIAGCGRVGSGLAKDLVAEGNEVAMIDENPDAFEPDLAMSLNNLAALYDAQHKYAQAEPLYKRSLAIWEKVLGPDHPYVCASLENMAELYRATNRPKEADALDRRAAKIRAKKR